MMIVWLVLLLGILHENTSALPRPKSWRDDKVLYQDEKPWDGRSYSYGFQTLFGSSRNEKAILKKDPLGEDYIDVEGEYTYPSPDGIVRKVSYRANLFGYQVTETKVGVHSTFDDKISIAEDAIPNSRHKVAAITSIQTNISISPNILPVDHNLKLQGIENINQDTIPNLEEDIKLNNSTISEAQKQQNGKRINLTHNIKTDDGAIFFPTDKPENYFSSSKEPSVLTTALIPSAATNATNETSSDYYYDDLGNRIGGIPPAVLGSLLG